MKKVAPRRAGDDPYPLRAAVSPARFLIAVTVAVALSLGIAYLLVGMRSASSSAVPDLSKVAAADSPAPDSETTAGDSNVVALDDTHFVLPPGWSIYADGSVAGRRVVWVSHPETDLRLQVGTLVDVDDLAEACQALVNDQSAEYRDVTVREPKVLENVPGEAVACGFAGVRIADDVANHVMFNLNRRPGDKHLLLLRRTEPKELSTVHPARAEQISLYCQASRSFGTPLPLC